MDAAMPVTSTFPHFDAFLFTHRAVEGRLVRLGYALLARDHRRVDFEETLELPPTLGPLGSASDPAVARALLGIHLAGGMSYWKTSVPPELRLESGPLSAPGEIIPDVGNQCSPAAKMMISGMPMTKYGIE